MKQVVSLLFFCGVLLQANAQDYAFFPDDHYSAQLAMEQYSVHQVDIQNTSGEEALITWRLIENTCPVGWEFILCDWPHCYDGMPNTGNMSAVAPGGYGLIKLTVNPYDIPGSGDLHFYIFPTGFNDQHVDLIFHFDTEVLSVAENELSGVVAYPQPASDRVFIRNISSGIIKVTDISGKVMTTSITSGNNGLDVSQWPAGIYFFQTTNGASGRLFIRHE